MKKTILLILCSICWISFSQKTKNQYFLIDNKDSLITKIVNSKGHINGYKIINKNKTIKKIIRASEINGDDIEIDAFEELLFTFNGNNDTIVDESYLKKYHIIKTRREFLKMNIKFDETKSRFVFIEPYKCGEYIIREVRPIILE